jgi:hypothetical protein
MSQIFKALSLAPETSHRPSGDKANAPTIPVCPSDGTTDTSERASVPKVRLKISEARTTDLKVEKNFGFLCLFDLAELASALAAP